MDRNKSVWTKKDVARGVARGVGLPHLETETVIDAFLTIIREGLIEGKRVDLRGFGSFRTQLRASRTGRNPATGEKIVIPARVVPVFRASQELKRVVRTGPDG